MFGAERNQDTHGEDFATDLIAVEVKHRSSLPKIVTDALAQVAEARPDRVPVAIFHQKGQRIEDSWAVLRARDLTVLHSCALYSDVGLTLTWASMDSEPVRSWNIPTSIEVPK